MHQTPPHLSTGGGGGERALGLPAFTMALGTTTIWRHRVAAADGWRRVVGLRRLRMTIAVRMALTAMKAIATAMPTAPAVLSAPLDCAGAGEALAR